MVQTVLSVCALGISILSLILSFMQNRDKSFKITHVNIKDVDDPIQYAFIGYDIVSIDFLNFNNRDMLISLSDGYIYSHGTNYAVKNPIYYTVKANSVTPLETYILVGKPHPCCKKKYEVWLVFKYKGLLFTRTYKYKQKNEQNK